VRLTFASRDSNGDVMGRSVGFFVCLTIGLVVSATIGHAEEIDLKRSMLSQLPAETKQRAATMCGLFDCSGGGIWFGNVRTVPVQVDYSDAKPAAIPFDIVKQVFLFRNCSADTRTDQRSTTLEYTSGYAVTKTDTVTNASGANASIEIKAVKLGVSDTVTVGFTSQETINKQEKRTEAVTMNEAIKPYTELTINIEKRISNSYIDFAGVVRVEADVFVAVAGGAHGKNIPLGRYADLVKGREVTLRGEVWLGRAESTTKSFQEHQYDQKSCPPGSSFEQVR
jgi:hypothetical protein